MMQKNHFLFKSLALLLCVFQHTHKEYYKYKM